jgi:hypothetical protein
MNQLLAVISRPPRLCRGPSAFLNDDDLDGDLDLIDFGPFLSHERSRAEVSAKCRADFTLDG